MDYYIVLHFNGTAQRIRVTVFSMEKACAHARKILTQDSAYESATVIEHNFYTGEETRREITR